jgi:hypothetical protein
VTLDAPSPYGAVQGYWLAVGGPADLQWIMPAIATAESGRIVNNVQQDQPYAYTGWGWFQITPGDSFPQLGIDNALLNPLTNTQAALLKYQDQGLDAWTTYTSGAYLAFLEPNSAPIMPGSTGPTSPTINFPATMYDSVEPSQCPPGAQMYAGYINGAYTSYNGLVALYGKDKVLSITVYPDAVADIYDCEPGNGSPDDCPGWYAIAKAGGIAIPIIYNPAGWTDQVFSKMQGIATPGSGWLCWSAHYGEGQHICDYSVCGYPPAHGTQWIDHGQPPDGKGNYDESWLSRSFLPILSPGSSAGPGPIQPTKPAPKPKPKGVPVFSSEIVQAHGASHVASINGSGELIHWRWVGTEKPFRQVIARGMKEPQAPTLGVSGNLLYGWAELADTTPVYFSTPWGGPWSAHEWKEG